MGYTGDTFWYWNIPSSLSPIPRSTEEILIADVIRTLPKQIQSFLAPTIVGSMAMVCCSASVKANVDWLMRWFFVLLLESNQTVSHSVRVLHLPCEEIQDGRYLPCGNLSQWTAVLQLISQCKIDFRSKKASFFLFYSTCWFPIQKWIKIHEPGIPGWEYRRQEGHRNSVVVVSWPTDWGVGSATGASLRQSQPTHQDVNFSHVTLHSSPRNAEKLWPKVSLLLFPNCFFYLWRNEHL